MYIHAIEISCVEVRALGIVHPGDLVSCLWRLGTGLYPPIEICSDRGHFVVKFGALLRRAVENVSVNAEDCLVDSRIDLVKLDDVYERLDVRPFALSRITGLFVSESPELTSGTWKLQNNQQDSPTL